MTLKCIFLVIVGLQIAGCLSPCITGQNPVTEDTPQQAEFDSPVMRALRWFKKEQNKDGSWSSRKDPKAVATGLALLCFLNQGETPASDEFGKTVEKAIRFLLSIQDENGRFAGATRNPAIEHGIIALALCETYGMTKIPIIKDAAIKAVDVILESQLPSGLWSSTYNTNAVHDIEASVWQIRALRKAKMAGLWELDERLKAAFTRTTNPLKAYVEEGKEQDGLAPIIVALQANWPPSNGNDTVYRTATETLNVQVMNWQKPPYDNPLYLWHYITLATKWHGGKVAHSWHILFGATLQKHQIIIENGGKDNKGRVVDIGYWSSPSKKERYGKIYATALCVLMETSYYKYGLPYGLRPRLTIPDGLEEDTIPDSQDISIEIL